MLDDQEPGEATEFDRNDDHENLVGTPKKSTQPPSAAADDGRSLSAKPPERPKSNIRLRAGIALVALIILATGAYYGHYWWTAGRFLVATDDAYVSAHGATLSPKVTGYISEIAATDNQHLKAGDVIARIDDGDYRLAVRSARDQVAAQKATIARIASQVTAQAAVVDQAQAQLASDKATETRTRLELRRQKDLAARSFSSRQKLEQARASFEQATAAVRSATAGIEAAKANVDVLRAQQVEAQRTLAQYRTALAKAERDLSFTVIRAPFDGVIGNRAMQVGDYVTPAKRLASLIPLNAIFVDANFKETQLARLKPGQPVAITVDAFPGREIEGRVQSIAPASGSVFSLLPPDNATGNFTKIVQRLPVRVALPADVAEQFLLRPGMSVYASVDTKAGARVADQRMSDGRLRTATR